MDDTLKIPREMTALIAALQLCKPDRTLLMALKDNEWENLLVFCDRANLTLCLAQLPQDGFPYWVVERLKVNIVDNTQRFERVKATYIEAAGALSRAGVDHVVIKGFTQAPDYVENPCLRAQSDIDLYCLPETIELARNALQSIGYQPNDRQTYTFADHDKTMTRIVDWQWRGNSFDPDMPLSIELHFCLWNESVSYFSASGIDEFWDRRVVRAIDGFSFSALSSVDHLGYLTLHILRNILLRDTIINHVYELARFLHHNAEDDVFWRNWTKTHDVSLRAYEAIAFYYAQAWFGCNLHRQARCVIEGLSPLQQKWLHSFAASALEGMLRMNKDFIWLHLSFLESPKAKLKLLKRTLLPTHFSRMNTSLVEVTCERTVGSKDMDPILQYLIYFVSRSVAHGRASVVTLVRGLCWRFSEHRFVSQFWMFLAASFFLTWGYLSTSFYLIFS